MSGLVQRYLYLKGNTYSDRIEKKRNKWKQKTKKETNEINKNPKFRRPLEVRNRLMSPLQKPKIVLPIKE
jgi:hypothetical protein